MKIRMILLFLVATLGVKAQWVQDTEVNTSVANTVGLDLYAVNNSLGETYVVFWKNVGPPVNIELRFQVLDVDGNRLLGPEGILLNDSIPMSTYVTVSSIAVDEDDNLFIGVTATGSSDGYLFKVDKAGNHLWSASGINLGLGFATKLLPLDNGGLLAAWLGNNGTAIQKYDADGNGVWNNPLILMTSSNNAPGDLFRMADDGFLLTYHAYNFGVASTFFAKRFDSDGNSVWTDDVQLCNLGTSWNRRYSSLQDGDTVYYGYSVADGTRFDSYIQRINPDGTLPFGINGVHFDVSQGEFETNTEIAHEAGSDHIWAVSTYSDNTQSMWGEYVQKFNKVTGERLLGENAHAVYPISNEAKKHAGRLTLVNDAPFFVLEIGLDNGVSPTTLNVIQLDENGNFAWSNEYEPIATFEANKSDMQLTQRVNGQNVVVFYEDKGDGNRIYAQNFVEMPSAVDETLIDHDQIKFQNPVTDGLDIRSQSAIENVVIYNMMGQSVFNRSYATNSNQVQLSVRGWGSGLYMMSIKTEEGLAKGLKFVVN